MDKSTMRMRKDSLAKIVSDIMIVACVFMALAAVAMDGCVARRQQEANWRQEIRLKESGQ